MPVKGQKFRKFTPEYKMKAVKMYYEQHKGVYTIAKELGLCSTSYIRRWLKAYNELGEAGLQDRRGLGKGVHTGRPTKPKGSDEELIRLRAENEYLKKLLLLEGWDGKK